MLTLCLTLGALVLLDQLWHRRAALSRRARWLWAGAAALALLGALLALPEAMMVGKILGHLAMPVGLLWMALLTAALLAWHRRRRARALWLTATWLALSLCGSPLLGGLLLDWLEAPYTQLRPLEADAPFDAVFVMGGGTALSPTGDPILGPSGDRVVLAARLYHAGLAPRLVTSGSSVPGVGQYRDSAFETSTVWTSLGVPSEAIIQLAGPRNTTEEARAYATLARARGWQRIGLVTSAWHLRRALRRCDDVGLQVVPLPADFRGAIPYHGLLSLIPSGAGFRRVQQASWELLGLLVQR